MEKLYTFNLTLAAAQIIVAGLKKLPMEVVENLIPDLEKQFQSQNTAPTPTPMETIGKVIDANEGTNVTDAVEAA